MLEVAVHGIDLADAVGTDRWTSTEAATHLTGTLLGEPARLKALGWAPVEFVAKATGRDPKTPSERDLVEACGHTWITLG